MYRAALAVFLCACAEPTQLILVCDTDLEPGVEVAAIEVRVSSSEAFADARRFDLDATELPFSLGVAPARRDGEAVRVTASALSPEGERVVGFIADTHFVPHQSRVLEIPLARACSLESTCHDAGLTCLRGECISTEIDPTTMPLADGTELQPLFDGPRVAPDAGVDAGACIEGASCTTENPCEIAVVSCTAEPSCVAVDTLAPGSECGGGRACDAEGRCGI